MSALPQTPMRWSLVTTGPYIEMLFDQLRGFERDDGTFVFRLPLGDGAIPFVHLDDLGHYVNWIFANPNESAGVNVKVAVAHVPGAYLAEIFTKVK
jgi:hypothetical protein